MMQSAYQPANNNTITPQFVTPQQLNRYTSMQEGTMPHLSEQNRQMSLNQASTGNVNQTIWQPLEGNMGNMGGNVSNMRSMNNMNGMSNMNNMGNMNNMSNMRTSGANSNSPASMTITTPSDIQNQNIPETVTNPMFWPAYLRNFIGLWVRVDFFIGNSLEQKVGQLLEVGASYIVLNVLEPETIVVCDIFAIKFVTVVFDSDFPKLVSL